MPVTQRQIEAWLREDLGHHDVTNEVPGETTGRLVTKTDGIVAGLNATTAVFEYLGVDVETTVSDGDRIEAGETVLRVEGKAKDVLRAERVAVNITGHASGIATQTHEAVNAAREVSESVEIAGTRKTTPGLRGIEKRAVVAGGGDSHRLDLSHMVMVKDNHVEEMGLEHAVEHFRERVSFATKVEVEVEQPEDGRFAAEAGADIVLFDNLSPAEVERGVELLPEDTLAEASGGITIADVPDYAATGVDVISMGSLTHSAPSLDFSFRTG
ncbi:carboxylating nicotinate-nucleotide diphosphorylase [Halovenus rubra]|uniref:Carboxylating nicotinate-nucleotide diphosphorylase n=2 Tax=Halovenus rubra TaxID=869890 RepID=A0ACC7DXE9_9EURY|nr:carboxylating nicotinate-nucleotide diphosphorylase [Halovenus rubra]